MVSSTHHSGDHSGHGDGLSPGDGPIFEARFSDGKTAAAVDVSVRLSERGILILPPEADQPVVWPYGALHTAEPLTPHAIDALITYAHMPGATLFVPEGTFARRLAGLAPHLTARAQRWAHAQPWFWGTAGIIALGALIWLSDLSPARAIAGMMPEKLRTRLGDQVVSSMSDNRKTCTESAGRAALDTLVRRLSDATGSERPFKVTVVDWGLLNAFATPGEQIVLTRGLIDKAQSADEVAGVIGHEMGHGLEMHPETGIVRALGLSAAMELMVGGGGGTIGNMGILLAQLSYTREAEHEADEQALRILKQAAVSARGLADFFKRIDDLEGRRPGSRSVGSIDILRSHPQTAQRRKRVESVGDYPSTPALTQTEWQDLKLICGMAKPDKSIKL